MRTGFNTDVDHAGQVFHVQTEDKGLDNPVIETLIYSGGAILTSRRVSYADLLASDGPSDEAVQRRIEEQHAALIGEVRSGRFAVAAPLPFGHELVTNRPLDEVVLTFLREHPDPDPIQLRALDWQMLREGTRPTLRLRVLRQADGTPVAGAEVAVTLVSAEAECAELCSSSTDEDGFVEAAFEIPEPAGVDPEIVCEARSGESRAILRQRVKTASRGRSPAASA